MLSKRMFEQLTDTILLGSRTAVPCCFCARCPTGTGRSPSLISQTCASQSRSASSASSNRWRSRQVRDQYAREAKVQGLKSRAAFKLVEMNEKYKLFRPSITVVDLGYAPGSWSQVAVSMTRPYGRVVGIDIIPAQPPKGASTIQGNFLSPEIQAEVRAYVRDPSRGRPRRKTVFASREDAEAEAEAGVGEDTARAAGVRAGNEGAEGEDARGVLNAEELVVAERGYVDFERHAELDVSQDKENRQDVFPNEKESNLQDEQRLSKKGRDEAEGRVVDVVLSDMSAPWPQTTGFWKRSVSDPYHRMMNTSGIPFRDHAGSMDLCLAALMFCFDTLRTGGHFVCKFYQGAEDKLLELKLRKLFDKVHREKPESSRSESKEAYFVALKRKDGVKKQEVFEG